MSLEASLRGTLMPPLAAGGLSRGSLNQAVDQWLEALFAQRLEEASTYGQQYTQLWHGLRDSARGGKRLRPGLLMDTYCLLGGDTGRLSDVVLPVAGAVELMHTAFLLHDDVIDQDFSRRGALNLKGRFTAAAEAMLTSGKARRWGDSAAILGGDLLLHESQLAVSASVLKPAIREQLLALMRQCLMITAAGELDDIAFELGLASPGLSEILTMYSRKTAFYTFEAPLLAGAILAGAAKITCTRLSAFSRAVGVAFQLRDDILGAFGDPTVTGKSVLTDLRSGKLTPLVWLACRRGADAELQVLLGAEDFDDIAAGKARAAIRASGAVTEIEEMIEAQVGQAITALEGDHVPEPLRRHLHAVAQSACERDR